MGKGGSKTGDEVGGKRPKSSFFHSKLTFFVESGRDFSILDGIFFWFFFRLIIESHTDTKNKLYLLGLKGECACWT